MSKEILKSGSVPMTDRRGQAYTGITRPRASILPVRLRVIVAPGESHERFDRYGGRKMLSCQPVSALIDTKNPRQSRSITLSIPSSAVSTVSQ